MIQPKYFAYIDIEAKARGDNTIEAAISCNKNNYYGKSDIEVLLKNNPDIKTTIERIIEELEGAAIYVSPINYDGKKRDIGKLREIVMNDKKTVIVIGGLTDVPKYENEKPTKTRFTIASESESTKDSYYDHILNRIMEYSKKE